MGKGSGSTCAERQPMMLGLSGGAEDAPVQKTSGWKFWQRKKDPQHEIPAQTKDASELPSSPLPPNRRHVLIARTRNRKNQETVRVIESGGVVKFLDSMSNAHSLKVKMEIVVQEEMPQGWETIDSVYQVPEDSSRSLSSNLHLAENVLRELEQHPEPVQIFKQVQEDGTIRLGLERRRIDVKQNEKFQAIQVREGVRKFDPETQGTEAMEYLAQLQLEIEHDRQAREAGYEATRQAAVDRVMVAQARMEEQARRRQDAQETLRAIEDAL